MARTPGYSEPLKDEYRQTASEVLGRDASQGKQEAAPEIATVDEPTRPTGHPGERPIYPDVPHMDQVQRAALVHDRLNNARYAEHNAEIALQRSGSGEPAAEPSNVKAEEHETAMAGGEMTDAQQARLNRLLDGMVSVPEHEHDQGLDMGRERGDDGGNS